jgi:hypothetical protein
VSIRFFDAPAMRWRDPESRRIEPEEGALAHDPDRPVPTTPARVRPAGGSALLALAEDKSELARGQLAALTPEVVAEGLYDLSPKQRLALLEVVPHIERVVPLISEAELTHTIREVGIADAGWLIEFASGEQRVAAVDLDCWKDHRFSPSRFNEWLDAMIEAGPETLAAAFEDIDIEVWLLALKHMADFRVWDGVDLEATGEGLTEDGLVYYDPRTSDAEERVQEILRTALQYTPSLYWAFVYGAMSGGEEGCERYAARWHAGRLNDLGFPDRELAMRAYRPLEVEATPVTDVGEAQADEGVALMTTAALPQRLAGTLVGRALAEMTPARASEVLGYVLAVANTLAVADELPLADLTSVERSFRKAIKGIDLGLAALAEAHALTPTQVLEQTPPLDLFRVGVSLDPELARGRSVAEFEAEQDRDDWNVEHEVISQADRALGPDGRPR